MSDLYQTLGVERDASPDEIKRAYRAKAQTTHPDAGGSAEAFVEVQKANVILRDPKKRRRYDKSGRVDDEPNNDVSQAAGLITGFFAHAVDEHLAGRAPDPFTLDLIAIAKNVLQRNIESMRLLREPVQKKSESLSRIASKLKLAKGKHNPIIQRSVASHAAIIAAQVEDMLDKERIHKLAIDMLADYKFVTDVTPYTFR